MTLAELAEFRELLRRAREYDKRHNEPECEMDSKRRAVKKLADRLGVDVSFVDGPRSKQRRKSPPTADAVARGPASQAEPSTRVKKEA